MNILRSPDCIPTLCVKSFADIDGEQIREEFPGTKVLTLDVHQMLTPQKSHELPPENKEKLVELKKQGWIMALISNAANPRRAEAVRGLGGEISELIGQEVPVVTSEEVDGLGKPHPAAFLRMAEILEVETTEIGHIDNQVLRGWLGARRAGYGFSILTGHYGPPETLQTRYWLRPVDALARAAIGIQRNNGTFIQH